jgi:glycosyltransferase involved in cell wall biosynthesis
MDTFPGLSFKMGKFYDFAFKIFYKSLGRFLFSGVNKLILYTHSLRRYAHYLNFENHKINVIPPGIETNIKEKKKDIRKEFRIDNDQRIILFVGILNKRKGVEKIIHIAKKFNKNDIKFIIVGDGAEKKNLMKKIEEYKLNQIIHLTGFRKDVHNFYQEADILLFPSNGEGLPGVLMEGMLYGVPIVANDIFGVRFLIKNKYNGLLCKTDSIEEYYEKISYLLNNKKLRIKFIKRSKKIIQNQFTWNKQIEKYKKLY